MGCSHLFTNILIDADIFCCKIIEANEICGLSINSTRGYKSLTIPTIVARKRNHKRARNRTTKQPIFDGCVALRLRFRSHLWTHLFLVGKFSLCQLIPFPFGEIENKLLLLC